MTGFRTALIQYGPYFAVPQPGAPEFPTAAGHLSVLIAGHHPCDPAASIPRRRRLGRMRYLRSEKEPMCRSIKTLHNFKPPATDEEIRASSLQFVRKLSGFTQPSKANEQAFNRAVDEVDRIVHELLA